jgi:hypothetical protein
VSSTRREVVTSAGGKRSSSSSWQHEVRGGVEDELRDRVRFMELQLASMREANSTLSQKLTDTQTKLQVALKVCVGRGPRAADLLCALFR